MKSDEEIMEILEAFDLTQSYRDAAELAGCDHHTVAHWIDRRDRGELSSALVTRDRLIGAFTDKCLSYAMADDDTAGIWAGTSAVDRRRLPQPTSESLAG